MKKSQISVEYLIVVGFVTFILIGILSVGVVYSNMLQDKIRLNQVQSFANKITSAAESIFYSGAPSKSTIYVYLPAGVRSITVSEKDLVIRVSTKAGDNVIAFASNVPLSGSLSPGMGLKKIVLAAQENNVLISN